MEIKKGWFAEVKHQGELTTVFIKELNYIDGQLYTAIGWGVVDNYWQKAFLPTEILRTWHDPSHPLYLKWKQAPKPKPKPPKTSIQWDRNAGEESKDRYWE